MSAVVKVREFIQGKYPVSPASSATPLIHPHEHHLKNMNPVQQLLMEIHRSKPYSGLFDDGKYAAGNIFKTVRATTTIPLATETFYLRSKSGSALWFRRWSELGMGGMGSEGDENKDDVSMVFMSPFDASFLWRFCPLLPAPLGSTTMTTEIKGGLLVSAKYSDHCLRCTKNLGGDQLIPIPIKEATVDDLWSFDSKSNQWSCNNGLITQSFCDHIDDGKFRHWTETEVQVVLTSDVNAVLAANNISWDKEFCRLPSFVSK